MGFVCHRVLKCASLNARDVYNFANLTSKPASVDTKVMAETKEQRAKRMATALRENLKRRKSQRAEVETSESDAEQRLFREKPIKPDIKR